MAACPCRGQTDADADAHVRRARDREVRDGPADHVGPRRGIRDVREQAGELLPTHAAEDRSRRHQGTGGLAEGHEGAIAGGMAAGIVDALEMIEIEQQQRRVRGAPVQEYLSLGHEGAAVGDSRERIRGGGEALEVLGALLGQGHQDEGEGQGQHHPEAGHDGEGRRRKEGDLLEGRALHDGHGNPRAVHGSVHHEQDRGRIARDQGFAAPPPDQGRRCEAEAARQARSQHDAGGHGVVELRHEARGAPQDDAGHDRPRAQAAAFEGAGAHPDEAVGADDQGVGDSDGEGVRDHAA